MELFNFITGVSKSVIVKLSKHSEHELVHGSTLLYNMHQVTFEPYNINLKLPTTNEYNSTTRVIILFKDSSVTISSPQSKFILLSLLSYNSTKIASISSDRLAYITSSVISLPIVESNVEFKFVRFKDSLTKISHEKVILIQAVRQEAKTLAFNNLDFQVYGTILVSHHPLQLSVVNVTIIDFVTNKAGFILNVNCNYPEAYLKGDILFERLKFSIESSEADQIRNNNFIKSNAPANFTIKDSVLSLHYNELEGLDAFLIEDKATCTPEDDLTQTVTFKHNTFSLDVAKTDSYNNLIVNFNGVNKRNFLVNVVENVFQNMHDTKKAFVDIEFFTVGTISVSDNVVTNSSSHEYQFVVNADDHIIANNNTFSNWVAYEYGFLTTDHAKSIEVHNMVIAGATHGNSAALGSLLLIKSHELGSVLIEGLKFSSNYAEYSVIELHESIGSLTFQHNKFSNEVLHSNTYYIKIGNPYSMMFKNVTFANVSDDHTAIEETSLISFSSIDLDNVGEIHMEYVTATNCSVSFLHLFSVSGHTVTTKIVRFEHITIKDASFLTRNDLLTFGPLYTEEDVDIHINDILLENLHFTKRANMIHLKQQTLDPFILENSIFRN